MSTTHQYFAVLIAVFCIIAAQMVTGFANSSIDDVSAENDVAHPSGRTGCYSSGGDYYGRAYYFEMQIKRNAKNAATFCKNIGMTLLNIETCEENNFIVKKVKSIGCISFPIWTSGKRSGSSFYWGNGKNVSYTNWRTGGPNLSSGRDCIHIVGNYMQWNTWNCGEAFFHICEENS